MRRCRTELILRRKKYVVLQVLRICCDTVISVTVRVTPRFFTESEKEVTKLQVDDRWKWKTDRQSVGPNKQPNYNKLWSPSVESCRR